MRGGVRCESKQSHLVPLKSSPRRRQAGRQADAGQKPDHCDDPASSKSRALLCCVQQNGARRSHSFFLKRLLRSLMTDAPFPAPSASIAVPRSLAHRSFRASVVRGHRPASTAAAPSSSSLLVGRRPRPRPEEPPIRISYVLPPWIHSRPGHAPLSGEPTRTIRAGAGAEPEQRSESVRPENSLPGCNSRAIRICMTSRDHTGHHHQRMCEPQHRVCCTPDVIASAESSIERRGLQKKIPSYLQHD